MKQLKAQVEKLDVQAKKLEEKVDTPQQLLGTQRYLGWAPLLQVEVQERWMNRHSRYTRVKVLLVSWRSDDMEPPVQTELEVLENVFTDIYHYEVSRFEIPDEQPFRTLSDHVVSFIDDDSSETLLIFYYAGHGKLQRPRNDLHWFA